MNQRERLIAAAVFYEGNWNRIKEALIKKEEFTNTSAQNCITIYDEEYPACLKELKYPPFVLFYKGDIGLLKKPMITIVGSRELSPYGKQVTEAASRILAKKYVIVSGLAKGADGSAHAMALRYGKTVGVIGSGLGTRYPAVNIPLYKEMEQRGLIVSEYPYHTGVRREHFPWRNRILAALSARVIVTGARLRSGTMLTVNEALELGRDVYCFPYPFGEESGMGCDRLILEGAGILYTEDQLYEL